MNSVSYNFKSKQLFWDNNDIDPKMDEDDIEEIESYRIDIPTKGPFILLAIKGPGECDFKMVQNIKEEMDRMISDLTNTAENEIDETRPFHIKGVVLKETTEIKHGYTISSKTYYNELDDYRVTFIFYSFE